MDVTSELTTLHRTVDRLRAVPSLWVGADDEGLGGYHR
jgi:hypothetical protein